jgi:hypothetical protein
MFELKAPGLVEKRLLKVAIDHHALQGLLTSLFLIILTIFTLYMPTQSFLSPNPDAKEMQNGGAVTSSRIGNLI